MCICRTDHSEQFKGMLSVGHIDLSVMEPPAASQIEQEEMNDWRNQAHQSQSAFDRLQDQLAKAEQRVAEACALQVATETKFHWLDAARVAKEIRSGEWRKFVKEV